MSRQDDHAPTPIADAIRRGMHARGLAARELARRLPDQNYATMYRILGDASPDLQTSTLLAFCRALEVDPDELLDAHRPVLEPEVEALLDAAEALDEADRWVLVRVIRSINERHAAEER